MWSIRASLFLGYLQIFSNFRPRKQLKSADFASKTGSNQQQTFYIPRSHCSKLVLGVLASTNLPYAPALARPQRQKACFRVPASANPPYTPACIRTTHIKACFGVPESTNLPCTPACIRTSTRRCTSHIQRQQIFLIQTVFLNNTVQIF